MVAIDKAVQAKAIELGRLAVRATTAAKSGHPTTALSLAHLTAVLMYRVMRWDPKRPEYGGADRLVLSEGHAVPIVYAACADLGVTLMHPLIRFDDVPERRAGRALRTYQRSQAAGLAFDG